MRGSVATAVGLVKECRVIFSEPACSSGKALIGRKTMSGATVSSGFMDRGRVPVCLAVRAEAAEAELPRAEVLRLAAPRAAKPTRRMLDSSTTW